MTHTTGPACWTPAYCRVCRRQFTPVGRSVVIEAADSYCDPHDPCDPTQVDQRERHLWSEHDDVRKITDPEGWAALARSAGCEVGES